MTTREWLDVLEETEAGETAHRQDADATRGGAILEGAVLDALIAGALIGAAIGAVGMYVWLCW